MAEVAQYQFSFNELAEMLVKRQNLNEGMWTAGFNLNIGTGLMGNAPGEVFPSAMVQITGVVLSRVDTSQPIPPSAVDAAVVNPKDGRVTSGSGKAGRRKTVL